MYVKNIIGLNLSGNDNVLIADLVPLFEVKELCNQRTSFHKWYLCMAFMSSTKKWISALEMHRRLGYKRYGTICRLMYKIREGYFEHAISEQIKL